MPHWKIFTDYLLDNQIKQPMKD